MGDGTWSTVSVNAALASLIGVVGTLLGSFTTYLFQSRAAKRTQEFQRDERLRQEQSQRDERLRQEQVTSCSAFAAALTELKQKLITLWYRQRDSGEADVRAAQIECDRAGANAEAARFRVQLVSGDPDLMTLADSAFDAIEPIRQAAFREDEAVTSASDENKLGEHETSFETAVKEFIQAARQQLRPADSS